MLGWPPEKTDRYSRYLLSYDPITFLSYLETIKSASVVTTRDGSRALVPTSLWLMSDSANVMFAAARGRCYIQNGSRSKEVQPPIDSEQTSADAWEALDEMEGRTPFPRATQQPLEAEGWKPWMPRGMQPVLEELPKWKVLLGILDEIESTMSSNPAPFREFSRSPKLHLDSDFGAQSHLGATQRSSWQRINRLAR